MLMGTYQPLASLAHIDDLDNWIKDLGADAQQKMPERVEKVWCFPASTWKEAFMHSLLTAPNCPQALILVDTENCRRLDKLSHYAAIAEAERGKREADENDIEACEDADCPDDSSELIIDPGELEDLQLARRKSRYRQASSPQCRASRDATADVHFEIALN